jgi:hypothetical protein
MIELVLNISPQHRLQNILACPLTSFEPGIVKETLKQLEQISWLMDIDTMILLVSQVNDYRLMTNQQTNPLLKKKEEQFTAELVKCIKKMISTDKLPQFPNNIQITKSSKILGAELILNGHNLSNLSLRPDGRSRNDYVKRSHFSQFVSLTPENI